MMSEGVHEFHIGDVLVNMNCTSKWVVVRVLSTSEYELKSAKNKVVMMLDFDTCERKYVRVGHWDFDKNMEIDDE